MLDNINIECILFLDIETVPMVSSFNKCPEPFRSLWETKAMLLKHEPHDTPETLWPRAGIYSEFGKIICISVAFFNNGQLRVKSFAGHDELKLLRDFSEMINKHYSKEDQLLCAHNGKEFDFPYMARRIIINGLKVPAILDIGGLKPWQVRHLDTMELWKFGDYKSYTSLELLAAVFGLPTPKDDIKGSDIHEVYWEQDDLNRITTYCQKDVVTVVQIFLKYKGKEAIPTDRIQITDINS